MEFKSFSKIESLRNVRMQITQKIHGTNAQIMIVPRDGEGDYLDIVRVDDKEYYVRAGSRTRWITPGDDNYGFAAFVHSNAEAIVRSLGPGQHFGEWAGLGINSGEGLTSKVFCLFDYWRYDKELPPQCVLVPVLYEGPFSLEKINEVMAELKTGGSKLSPGFMRPEGIVISFMGKRIKKVFEAEESAWKGGDPMARALKDKMRMEDKSFELVEHLLQPVRLEKLLSRDERYLISYPKSLPMICKDYTQDLLDEGQITGDESQVSSMKKILGKHLFPFVKAEVNRLSGI
jgi:hypothetical protein